MRLTLALAALLPLSSSVTAQVAWNYDVIDIGPADEWSVSVNAHGDVAFGYNHHAWLWKDGQRIELPDPPGGGPSTPFAINDSGDVVGCTRMSGGDHAVLWRDGVPIVLQIDADESQPFDINNSSQIVGVITLENGDELGFRYDDDGLFTLPVPERATAVAIDEDGRIVGSGNFPSGRKPYLYDDGSVTQLGTFGGDINDSFASAISAYGITGTVWWSGDLIPWLYRGEEMLPLPHLGSSEISVPLEINTHGLIVGYSNGQAVAWHDFEVSALESLIVEPGWHLDRASDINDSGQIAGYGGLDGQGHAFLLNPTCRAVRHCEATPNSTGVPAVIDWTGSLSLGATDLTLTADSCPPGRFGVFCYGPERASVPLGNGNLCVGAGSIGILRIPPAVLTDSSGQVEFELDFGAPPIGDGLGALLSGSTWNFQFWFRDSGGAGSNLTDAVELSFCP